MYSSINVHNYLQELDIQHEIFKLSDRARDLEQAAAALGLDPRVLALVRFFLIDGKPYAVIVPGAREVDMDKLKEVTRAEVVTPFPREDISQLTGYLEGAVPPVALKEEIPVLIDYYSLREDVVYTCSGEPTAILKIRSYDLVRATGGEIADLVVSQEEG